MSHQLREAIRKLLGVRELNGDELSSEAQAAINTAKSAAGLSATATRDTPRRFVVYTYYAEARQITADVVIARNVAHAVDRVSYCRHDGLIDDGGDLLENVIAAYQQIANEPDEQIEAAWLAQCAEERAGLEDDDDADDTEGGAQ